MKKVLILASDRAELAGYPEDFVTVVTGVGLENSVLFASEAIMREKPSLVINVGSAGARKDSAGIGEVVRIREVWNLDYDLTAYRLAKYATLDEKRATVSSIRLADEGLVLGSSNKFTSESRDNRIDLYDMEGYGAALAARHFGLPCAIFKGVTDIVGEHVKLSDYRETLKNLRTALAGEVIAFAERV